MHATEHVHQFRVVPKGFWPRVAEFMRWSEILLAHVAFILWNIYWTMGAYACDIPGDKMHRLNVCFLATCVSEKGCSL